VGFSSQYADPSFPMQDAKVGPGHCSGPAHRDRLQFWGSVVGTLRRGQRSGTGYTLTRTRSDFRIESKLSDDPAVRHTSSDMSNGATGFYDFGDDSS
jgi:hypothetical protein